VHSTVDHRRHAVVGFDGVASTARVYDDRGVLVDEQALDGLGTVLLPAGGLAVITR
jgi:hypothetical protein